MKQFLVIITALTLSATLAVSAAEPVIKKVDIAPGNNNAEHSFTITLSATGGTGGPYSYWIYDITGTTLLQGANSTGAFTDLPQGTYTYAFSDGVTTVGPHSLETLFSVGTPAVPITYELNPSGCNGTKTFFFNHTCLAPEVGIPAPLLVEANAPTDCQITAVVNARLDSNCPCYCPNTISVSNVTGGTPPYEYSIARPPKPATRFRPIDKSFRCLPDGAYIVTIRDAAGCTLVQQLQISNLSE